jgi:hypothetical protein
MGGMSTAGALTREPVPVTHRGLACRTWYAILAVVIIVALIIQIVLLTRDGTDVNTASPEGSVRLIVRYVRLVSFFTIESNLLVLALAVSLVLNPARDGRLWRVLNADALLGIAITGLVFGTVLASQVHLHGIAVWVNAAFHYFSPAWAVVGWLLFGPRPRLDWATFGWLFVWPVLWLIYTFAHGAATGWYPYPFMNVNLHGYGVALRNTAAVLVLGLVIAGLMRFLDRRLPAITR